MLNGSTLCGGKMLIFLDFDGVIVHSGQKCYKDIDPDCVAVIKALCDKYDAKIVVSSAWRILSTIEELEFTLFSYGLDKGRVIGKTRITKGAEGRRDEEIEDWLKDNKYTGEYVVIDDDIFDLDRLPKERLIHVEDGWNTGGIKQEHIDKWEKQRP